MGFGSMLDLFKNDNWSNKLVQRINKMLELGSEMFNYATGILLEGKEDHNPQAMVYDRDKRINKLERKIRRRVVSRLSIVGSEADIPSALIFTNVVKDCERLGDYVKNVYEVEAMLPDNPDRELLRKWLGEPTANITDLFGKARQAFAESDEEIAGMVIKQTKLQGKLYEEMIRQITTSDLPTNEAVCLVLVLRFYKRLAAHMGNIASSVVMPVDMIDFYDEDDH